jgi:hypothetical protein
MLLGIKCCYSVVFGNIDQIVNNGSRIFGRNRIFSIGNAAEYSVSSKVENSCFGRLLVVITYKKFQVDISIKL